MNYTNIYKRIILCAILCSILLSLGAYAQTNIIAHEVPYKIYYNDKEMKMQQPVVAIENSTYVPLREMWEKIGVQVDWIGEFDKIFLRGTAIKNEENIIRLYIYPQDIYGFAYQIDLTKEGKVVTSIGRASEVLPVDHSEFFTPRVTRYASLNSSETEELSGLVSQISMADTGTDTKAVGSFAAWRIAVIYQNRVMDYKYFNKEYPELWESFQESCNVSDHIFEMISKLQEYSPIEIVTFGCDFLFNTEHSPDGYLTEEQLEIFDIIADRVACNCRGRKRKLLCR